MKISASIYSDKQRSLEEIIRDLDAHQVDLFHVDCNDDPSVFQDIERIRKISKTKIDLHLITANPSAYFDLLRKHPVDYLTFQFEELKAPLLLPEDIKGKKGIAITTNTPVDIFQGFSGYDFILIMATTPGQSGGKFDRNNFQKIRKFRKMYPSKSIHVDGGVNGEVSFILRNMGVSSCVSGSYLFNAPSIGQALMNLTKREIESSFQVKDFMMPIEECPVCYSSVHSPKEIVQVVDEGKLGFALILSEDGKLSGIASSADIRKGLLKKWEDFQNVTISDFVNPSPLTIKESATVVELLQLIKKCSFPIMYLPVINSIGDASGIINFTHLIKGEI